MIKLMIIYFYSFPHYRKTERWVIFNDINDIVMETRERERERSR